MERHPDCVCESHGPDDDCWCLILFTLDELIAVREAEEAEARGSS